MDRPKNRGQALLRKLLLRYDSIQALADAIGFARPIVSRWLYTELKPGRKPASALATWGIPATAWDEPVRRAA
jgi:hypothetical protein